MYRSIPMNIRSESISLIINPLSLEAISISKGDLPLSIDFVPLPFSLIATAIRKRLNPFPFSFTIDPLPCVRAS